MLIIRLNGCHHQKALDGRRGRGESSERRIRGRLSRTDSVKRVAEVQARRDRRGASDGN